MDSSVGSSENKTAISRVFALGAPLLMFIAYLRGKWLDVEVESVKDSEQVHDEI